MLAIDFYSLCHTLREINPRPTEIADLWKGVIARDPEVVILVDHKPYWRTKIYPEYKAGRCSPQIAENIIEAGVSLGLPTLCKEGLEADDWAGLMYLDRVLNNRQGVLRFLTVDTDWMQLIDDKLGVEWENLGGHSPYLRREPEALKWAYTRHKVWIPHPRYIGNLKRVLGDRVDNIPAKCPLPLTELIGLEWQEALTQAGYSIPGLLGEVAKVYDRPHGIGLTQTLTPLSDSLGPLALTA